MAELDCCPCGIAWDDCDYHRARHWVSEARPYVGDFVGIAINDGDWLYIGAVNYDARLVRIGPMTASLSDWLTETQARAIYSYEWGQKKSMTPWLD